MEKCANAIAAWLVDSGVIEATDRELYIYAVHSLLISVSTLILSMVFGSIMGRFVQSVVLIIPFIIIRKFSGGYHTKHSFTCLVGSCLLLLLCIAMTSCVECNIGLAVVTLWAMVSLMIYSPVDSENRRLNATEKKRYKRITIVLTVIFGAVCVMLYILGVNTYTVCVSIGLILAAGMQVPCIVQRVVQLLYSVQKEK